MSTSDVILESVKNGYHENQVVVEGVVTKVWKKRTKISANDERPSLHVFVRMAIYDDKTQKGYINSALNRTPHYLTLLIMNGKVDGVRVPIQRHDHVSIEGHLVDVVSFESLSDFLKKCRVSPQEISRMEDHRLANSRCARVATYIVPEKLTLHTV